MKITYNKNPLYTTVELDENEKKEFWYKIKIEEMTNLLFEAHFYSDSERFDLERVKRAVDPEYYLKEGHKGKDGEKTKLDEECDVRLKAYLDDLRGCHVDDCTCVPCSCSKCHAESLLCIDTMPGLGKHSAHKIDAAFGKDNEKSIEQAIESLANYNPYLPSPPKDAKVWEKLGGYEQYIPRWNKEAKAAHDWLVNYKNKHFGDSNGTSFS